MFSPFTVGTLGLWELRPLVLREEFELVSLGSKPLPFHADSISDIKKTPLSPSGSSGSGSTKIILTSAS